MKLTKNHLLTTLVTLALVGIAGSLIASNMGFMKQVDMDYNAAGRNLFGIALPHHNPWIDTDKDGNPATMDASELLIDTWDGTSQLSLIKYDNAKAMDVARVIMFSGYTSYPTTFAGEDYDFQVGEGYWFSITANIKGSVFTGSHNPNWSGATYEYNAAGRNLFGLSITPNTTWANTDDALIGLWDNTNQLSLIKYDNAKAMDVARVIMFSGYTSYPTTFAGEQFPLVAFEGYNLSITADVTRIAEPYY